MHADQTHGINDLRVFYINNKKPIPIYVDYPTEKYLKKISHIVLKIIVKNIQLFLK